MQTMFSYIRGELAEVMEEGMVIETGGVGFFVRVPQTVVSALPPQGRIMKIYTHFRVSEDAMQLYGFLSREDLELFRMLLGVSGVGPKAALGVLSVLTADDVRFAVLSDDSKTMRESAGDWPQDGEEDYPGAEGSSESGGCFRTSSESEPAGGRRTAAGDEPAG